MADAERSQRSECIGGPLDGDTLVKPTRKDKAEARRTNGTLFAGRLTDDFKRYHLYYFNRVKGVYEFQRTLVSDVPFTLETLLEMINAL